MKPVGILLLIGVAFVIYIFTSKDEDQPAKEFVSKSVFKIFSRDFRLNAYEGITNTYSAKSDEAFLKNNGPLILKKNVVIRKRQGKQEVLSTDEARLILARTEAPGLLGFSKIDEIDLIKNVRIQASKLKINTSRANYHLVDKVISSQDPVLISGPGQVLKGSQGFKLNLSNEELEIFGDIEGQFEAER